MKTMNKKELLEEVSNLINSGLEMCLVTIQEIKGSAPRTKDAFMFVNAKGDIWGTIGGGKVEYIAISDAKNCIEKKENTSKHYFLDSTSVENLQMVCGGNIIANFEYISARSDISDIKKKLFASDKNKGRAIIFGAGHVGSHLAKILNYLGFDVTIWDERKEFFDEEMAKSINFIISPYENINDMLNITNNDYVLIMTHGHVTDLKVIKQLLKTKPYYIGCIGSASKINFIKTELKECGYDEKEIEQLHMPIGFNIGAETPEEIAISISAELVLSRSIKENRRKITKLNK